MIHFHFRLSPLHLFGRLIIQVANPDCKIHLLRLSFYLSVFSKPLVLLHIAYAPGVV